MPPKLGLQNFGATLFRLQAAEPLMADSLIILLEPKFVTRAMRGVNVGKVVEKSLIKRHADRLESHEPLPINASIMLAVKALNYPRMYVHHTSSDAALLAGKEGFVKYIEAHRGPVASLLIVERTLHSRGVQLHNRPVEFLRISTTERGATDEATEFALTKGDTFRNRETFFGQLLGNGLEDFVGEGGGVAEFRIWPDNHRLLKGLLKAVSGFATAS